MIFGYICFCSSFSPNLLGGETPSQKRRSAINLRPRGSAALRDAIRQQLAAFDLTYLGSGGPWTCSPWFESTKTGFSVFTVFLGMGIFWMGNGEKLLKNFLGVFWWFKTLFVMFVLWKGSVSLFALTSMFCWNGYFKPATRHTWPTVSSIQNAVIPHVDVCWCVCYLMRCRVGSTGTILGSKSLTSRFQYEICLQFWECWANLPCVYFIYMHVNIYFKLSITVVTTCVMF